MSRRIVLTPHGSVRQVNIKGPITTIGRDPTCGVHIDSLGVSRHHAAIRWTGDRFVVRDMASRHIWLNGSCSSTQPSGHWIN